LDLETAGEREAGVQPELARPMGDLADAKARRDRGTPTRQRALASPETAREPTAVGVSR